MVHPSAPSPSPPSDDEVSNTGAPAEHDACTSDSPSPPVRRNDTSTVLVLRSIVYDQPLRGVAKRRVRVVPRQLTPTEPPVTLVESSTAGGRGADDDEALERGPEVVARGEVRGVAGDGRGDVGGDVVADVGADVVAGVVACAVRDGRGGVGRVVVADGAEVVPTVDASPVGRGPDCVSSGRAPSER